MVLEAVVIIVDNSDHMLNGDYVPNRFDAQNDAVSILFQAKTQSNPENTVGLMSMAGKTPEVLVTPQDDFGKILTALHSLKIGGKADLSTAISVAQLALKHRQNKNQRQRIIAFVGSPLGVKDDTDLVKLARQMKKNNVAIDVVTFGEPAEVNGQSAGSASTMQLDGATEVNGVSVNDSADLKALRSFIEAVNSGENSHLLVIPPGPQLISDTLLSSPIVAEEGALDASGAGQATGAQNHEFGVDPSLDPELAMALRMSMEEENARQAASATTSTPAVAAQNAATSEPTPSSAIDPSALATPAQSAPTTIPSAPTKSDREAETARTVGTTSALLADNTDDDEEAMMQRALAMSVMQDGAPQAGTSQTGGMEVDNPNQDEVDEDEEIARAIAMSMQEDPNGGSGAK